MSNLFFLSLSFKSSSHVVKSAVSLSNGAKLPMFSVRSISVYAVYFFSLYPRALSLLC